MNKLIFALASFMFLVSCDDGRLETQVDSRSINAVTSPSGNLRVEVFLADDGAPVYRTFLDGELLVDQSSLGFKLKDTSDLDTDFRILKSELSRFDETWEQPWGEERLIRNNYKQLHVSLQENVSPERHLNITFRVYDDGFGFRYEFPGQDSLSDFAIIEELTEFNFTQDHSAWWTPALAGNQYEYLYRNTPLSKIELAHTPITLETKSGHYLSLHEAALHDYSTMNLAFASNNTLKASLVPWSPNTNVSVKAQTPFVTPWRTIQVADTAAELITSYLTLNLNEPNKLGDVSWVKPGKYIGIWWMLHLEKGSWNQGARHGATTENAKKYIDFAAAHGFDGVLVEGWNYGWDGEWWNHGGDAFNFTKPYPDYDVDEVTRYANEKGVYIIGHHETGAAVDNYENQLDEAYQFLQDHGMKAVKTGYVETGELLTNGNYHHGQSFVRHVDKVTKIAAKHKVMVVAHETVKDTGERRTYPNLVSREVARGQEYDAWSDDGGNPPNHTTILPFTRMLSGPMDFTPGAFELSLPDRPNNQVNTTLAKQLALYVVIYSPVQMASDLPENYEKHLDAFQFIKDVPVDWETTRVLSGAIGKHITIARKERGADNWFLGAITNEKERQVEVDLSFLDPDKTYIAHIYKDSPDAHYKTNPASYVIEQKPVSVGDKLQLVLAAGGGAAVGFFAQ